MRHPILLSTLLCMAVASPAFAQTFPARMTVLTETEVRSGPSKQLYATSKVAKGETVTVLRECKDQPGWYEIEPPKGSFNWINGKYVKQIDARHAYVDTDPSHPAPAYAGSVVINIQPTREITKLTGGTALNIVGNQVTAGSDTWFSIQPNTGEVRYIPAEAVKPATLIVSTGVGTPNWSLSPNGYTSNSTLAEAEKAAAANDTARARDLFQQVANTTSDQNQKFYALNRVRELSGPSPQVPATTTSLSPATPVASALVTLNPPAWSKYGRLYSTNQLSDNGQPLYRLDDGVSKTPTYVTNNPGTSLQSYINRVIAVYGPTVYRADSAVRMQVVVASHVALPP